MCIHGAISGFQRLIGAGATRKGTTSMRNLVYGVASAASVALASPALAADLPVTRYGEPGVTYQREVHKYEYRQEAPRIVVRRPIVTAPVVTETVVVRRPIVVIEQPVVVED